jgi:hypothetical protein
MALHGSQHTDSSFYVLDPIETCGVQHIRYPIYDDPDLHSYDWKDSAPPRHNRVLNHARRNLNVIEEKSSVSIEKDTDPPSHARCIGKCGRSCVEWVSWVKKRTRARSPALLSRIDLLFSRLWQRDSEIQNEPWQ